ncbi:MAG: transglutaminase family protein [Dehalococcoidia bacterium]|nr:transglutaminase family protein [Dehalococcoidia bacterium]
MIVAVEWHSTYRYSSAVRQVHNELRVLPAIRDGQRRLEYTLTTDPPARLQLLTDAFGNEYHYFDLLGQITQFTATLRATVDTASDLVRDPASSELTQFLMRQPTVRCPFDPRIGALLREAGAHGGPLSVANRVMALMNDRFQFEVGHTSVEDTALGLVDLGHGVCQDFTHLMLAILRMGGFPARYVSGYLAPSSGEAVADASHAWVQVYSDGAWHGFDPSNGQHQDARYVVSGVGRDYDDVPPLRGSFRGAAEQDWQARVAVAAQQQQQQ